MNPRQINLLKSLSSEERLTRLNNVLDLRIDQITLVMDDLYDTHNISAVIRTAEGLGIQDIHVISDKHEFVISKAITKYSHKWIDIHQYSSAEECITHLKQKSFKVYAAALKETSVKLEDIEITENNKVAYVLGNEHAGLSDHMIELCDSPFIIPMTGFTQSFNVSVAAAMILHHSITEKRKLLHFSGTLSPERKKNLMSEWLKKSVKHSQKILKAVE